MKKTFILLFIIVGSALCENKISMNSEESDAKLKEREYFCSFTVGVIEFTSLSVGYQINQSFSVSLKAHNIATIISLGMITAWDGGISCSYYYEDDLLNSIKLSIFPIHYSNEKNISEDLTKVISVECTLNNEETISQTTRFYYEFGGAVCIWKDRDAFFAPSIKFGLLCNF